jgi:hypothetical protein
MNTKNKKAKAKNIPAEAKSFVTVTKLSTKNPKVTFKAYREMEDAFHVLHESADNLFAETSDCAVFADFPEVKTVEHLLAWAEARDPQDFSDPLLEVIRAHMVYTQAHKEFLATFKTEQVSVAAE